MDSETATKILHAVDAAFDGQTGFLGQLTAHASTRGKEQGAQDFMAGEMAARGLSVDRWQIDIAEIRDLPGFSPP